MTHFLLTLQAAFVAFTRLPLATGKLRESHFQQAHYFLPFVGLVIGLGMVTVYQLCSLHFSPNTSAFFALMTGILLTGGLHEDGFADCCDGFGGGKNRDHIIAIMKDPRLGSFGVLGLFMLIGSKIVLLAEIPDGFHINALLTLSVASRIAPLLVMAMMPYVADSPSKMTKGLAIKITPLCISFLFAITCLLVLQPLHFTMYIASLVVAISFLAKYYMAQRLQGYNGDCLGAVEQITECMLLMLLATYY